MSAAQDQLTAGNVLTAPPAIFDYSNAAYLKAAITKWPSCDAPSKPTATAASVDLEAIATQRNGDMPLVDVTQGDTNMCSAFAFAQGYSVKYALDGKSGSIVPQLSPVYAYYLQRVEECSTTGVCPCPKCPADTTCTSTCDPPCVDCGSYILSAASIYGAGVCTSADWPLSTPMNTQPSQAARKAAANQRVAGLTCVPVDASSIRAHLAAGNPVILFLNITDAQLKWMQALVNATTSDTNPAVTSSAVQIVYVPDDKATAGHVVCAVGYTSDVLIIRNSYGFKWGAQGRFAIPLPSVVPQFIHEAAAITMVQ
jgi:hypothetical protein